MSTVIICRGVPASGKSTFAKAWVAASSSTRVRVNRDNLRWTLGIRHGVGTNDQEKEVTVLQDFMIERALIQGKDVVVDNTNLRARNVKDILKLAQKHSATVVFEDFNITQQDAVSRDIKRMEAGERFVGAEVIENFFKKFIKKGQLPPFPELEGTELAPKFKPYVAPVNHLPAIIVDIDGTLAHMQGRSPYDPTRYHEDKFDHTIGAIVEDWEERTGGHVIVMSGRDAKYRHQTVQWLDKHKFYYDELFMRSQGDTRNDAIVKDELFEVHVAENYDVKFVLDDRNRVVDMWRAKGLKCLQVAAGDF